VRIFVTGATGFVGRWLCDELGRAGHDVLPSPPRSRLPITDFDLIGNALDRARPDAVVHLAAVSFRPDAASDPAVALSVNVGGTLAVVQAALALERWPLLLVASSSEVYGAPGDESGPLHELSPIRAQGVYGLTKVAQESVAIAAAVSHGLRVIVARPFNHTGPGQRSVFAVPAFVARALAVQAGTARTIPVGNVDVRRDIGDVRDVVRAYRLLLEAGQGGGLGSLPSIFNIATGHAVTMRSILEEICRAVGVECTLTVDPQFVRRNDPATIVGDSTRLASAVGWAPHIPLERTVGDMVEAAKAPA
jgi:GDP-4-dehydro-6-deoxy-D-mannose reductase